ncbi:cytochrome-c peroxidase [Nannocystaceae bacterium ST9]
MTKPGSNRRSQALFITLVGSLGLAACGGADEGHGAGHGQPGFESHLGGMPPAKPKAPAIDVDALRARAAKEFGKLPEQFVRAGNPISDDKITLGRMLFYDKRLSKNQDIACNSCHVLAEYGVDSMATSPGHKGQLGERNSPTVYNAGGHLAQFWDGRAADLEAQAKGPVLNPVEMAMPNEEAVVAVLKSIPGYVEAFGKAFPGVENPIDFNNMALAIGAFESKLVTPAPIDKWLAGDDAALSPEALAGLQLFLDTQCATCHNGPSIGGNMYQKLGSVKPWEGIEDVGRFAVTADERDKQVFKVPGLRNIDKTGPYLHDGSIAALPEMVRKMVEHQTNRTSPLSEAELAQMIAFLGSLTGELPTAYIAEPKLPESGPETPAPDPS